jgi:CheY-like chemotaxis protein
MGGEIRVESVEGGGTKFQFTVALAGEVGARPFDSGEVLKPYRVLFLDRSTAGRAVLSRYTRDWGISAKVVADAAEAREELERAAMAGQPFDIAVVDDVELLRQLAAHPVSSSTRLLLLARAGVLPGKTVAVARILKPVKRLALVNALRSALEGRNHGTATPHKEVAPAPNSRGRVLIAEDNPVNQRVARLQVERLGFQADVVGNGREALEALENLAYALVLMDCQMPEMDGYAATRELRRREGGKRHLPVIAMTANAFSTDREVCLAAGMDDYVSKPVNLRGLEEILDRWAGAPVS